MQRFPIKDDDIRKRALPQMTAVCQAETICRHPCHSMDQRFQRQLILIAAQITDRKTEVHRIRRHLDVVVQAEIHLPAAGESIRAGHGQRTQAKQIVGLHRIRQRHFRSHIAIFGKQIHHQVQRILAAFLRQRHQVLSNPGRIAMPGDGQNRIHAHHRLTAVHQRIHAAFHNLPDHLPEIRHPEAFRQMPPAAAHQHKRPQEGGKIRHRHIHAVRRRNHIIRQITSLPDHLFKIFERFAGRFGVACLIAAHAQRMHMRHIGPDSGRHGFLQHILIAAHAVHLALRVIIAGMRSKNTVVFPHDFQHPHHFIKGGKRPWHIRWIPAGGQSE